MRERAAAAVGVCALALAGLGCTAGLFPRPAEVARPGRVTFMVHQVYAGIAPARATVPDSTDTTTPARVAGNGASPIGRQGSMVGWGPLVGIEARVGVGMFDPCEGAALVGISRLAGELRCAVASGAGGGAAVSLSGAAGYEPFFSRDGWWGRLAVDVSTPFAPVRLLFGAAVSLGPEAYSIAVDRTEDFTLPDDALEPYAQLRRREARLSLAIGTAFSGPAHGSSLEVDGISFRGYRGTTYVLGLVPHVTLASSDERRDCVGCSTATTAQFSVGFGVSIVVGVGWFDPAGIPSPFAPERVRIE